MKPYRGIMEDDQIASDNLEGRFKRRLFLSFARTSLAIAKRIENELIRAQFGVDPWRYEPGDPQGPDTRQSDNFVAQMERFEQDHPGIMERLEAILRRCVACVFVVSNASICSAACNVEAFVVACRFRQNRQR